MLRLAVSLSIRSMIRYILPLLFLFLLVEKSHSQQIIEDVGHYTQIGLPLTALGISIAKGDKEGVTSLLKSFVVETAVAQSLKRIVNTKRPSGGRHSFPSGHTAVSFMSSTYLWKRYGWEYGVPATVLAGFVGYSRFGTDEPVHYFTDVVAGAIVGLACSLLFTKERQNKVNVDVMGDMSYLGFRLKVNLN